MKRISFVAFLSVILCLFYACTNEVTPIGWGLTNGLLGTDFTDTCTVEAYSLLEDTINTTNLSANMIGQLHDPVFGNSTASTCAQFTLSGSSLNFGSSPVLDSVVLTLHISNYYGDTTSKVGIRVYQLTEALSSNSRYNSSSTTAYDATPLNYSLTGYTIQPHTSVVVDTGSYSPHLRIRLSQAFGQYLLNNQSQMSNVASFESFFKGLRISAVSHTGNTGYILISNITSSLTGITLYYHNGGTASKYTFPCKSDCMRYTNIAHDYNASQDADFTQEVLLGQQSVGRNKLFVQASGGVKTKITFPHLHEAFQHLNNQVVINRAELVISNVSPDEAYLIQPNGLSLQGIRKSDGGNDYLPDDEYYMGTTYFGGTYDANQHEYRFRITEYIQGQIMGNSNLTNTLNLVVKGAGMRANRLIMGGTGLTDDKRLRLELSYTTY